MCFLCFFVFCKLFVCSLIFLFLKSFVVREFFCLDDLLGLFDSLEESRVSVVLYVT